MRVPADPAAPPAPTEISLPSLTVTEPRSMTLPVPSMIRALVMTRFCAEAASANPNAAQPATILNFIAYLPDE